MPSPGDVVVRTLWSGISRGTERLVFEGRVPDKTLDELIADGRAHGDTKEKARLELEAASPSAQSADPEKA